MRVCVVMVVNGKMLSNRNCAPKVPAGHGVINRPGLGAHSRGGHSTRQTPLQDFNGSRQISPHYARQNIAPHDSHDLVAR